MKIAIVDDEDEHIALLEDYIARYAAENDLGDCAVDVFHDGAELLENYRPLYDIIFLDIEMPNADGMKTARIIRQTDEHTAIIFVTRMARYAIKGYYVDALDFMVKPVAYPTFALKMKKAVRYCGNAEQKKLVLKFGGEMVCLTMPEIYYIEILAHEVIYHTRRGEYKMFGSLKSVMELLTDDFIMCHRCYIINMRYVEAVKDNSVTVNGTELIVSRYKKKNVVESLAAYWSRSGGGVV